MLNLAIRSSYVKIENIFAYNKPLNSMLVSVIDIDKCSESHRFPCAVFQWMRCFTQNSGSAWTLLDQ